MSSADCTFATRTTTKLLDALRDHDNEPVWAHVDARYRPVIAALARRLGLNASDAEEHFFKEGYPPKYALRQILVHDLEIARHQAGEIGRER